MTNWAWHRRAQDSIAHAALTNSKRVETFVKGVYPTHLVRGQGAHVWDTDGKRYLDFVCGLGTNLLGYGNPEISAVVTDRFNKGAVLSLGTSLEVEAAEKVKEIIPFVEKVRFLKTGSDACNAAIRIARAKTGRKIVFSEGYHGWSDEFVSLTPPANGVNFSPWMSRLDPKTPPDLRDAAAVIIEPIITDQSAERIAWLRNLREQCTRSGALLIFDEVITGLRFPKWTVAQSFGIEPDLICLGKAIGGGLPLSVVGGKASVMDCEYFVSSTFAGDTLALAAAMKTITLLQTKQKPAELWERGAKFLDEFNAIQPESLQIQGYPTRGAFVGDEMIKALFWQEACKAGILFGPSWFLCFPHLEHLDSVISTSKDILTRIRTGTVKLEGELPKKPYAQQMRDKS